MLSRLEDHLFPPRRLLMFGAASCASYAAVFAIYLVGQWLSDVSGPPGFIDFVCFWMGGRFSVSGAAASAYDYATFVAAQTSFVTAPRDDLPYHGFPYPPMMLLFITPLGLLPYAAAFAVWIVATGSVYLFAIYRIVPRKTAVLLALASYAVPTNLYLGQTGFFVAGLLGLSLFFMARRPLLAGVCLGLLTCKPQFGLIFPVVLLVTWQWRVILGACLSASLLIVAATVAYGVPIWRAYSLTFGGSKLETLLPDGLQAFMQTVFGLMVWADFGVGMRWGVHIAAVVLTTTLVCIIFWRPVSDNLKAAALGIAALAATPYMLAYDLTALSVPVAFLVREGLRSGFLPGERLALLGCGGLLFLLRQMPVGPVILMILMAMVVRRAFSPELQRLSLFVRRNGRAATAGSDAQPAR